MSKWHLIHVEESQVILMDKETREILVGMVGNWITKFDADLIPGKPRGKGKRAKEVPISMGAFTGKGTPQAHE